MANIEIIDLPSAGVITGTESVPIVQNGVTVQTTTGAIAASPSQNQTFLTRDQEITLPNSQYLSTGTDLGLTSGGPQSFYRISLTGAAGDLAGLGGGFVVKNGAGTLVARSMAVSGAGLSVSNADGTGADPIFALSGVAAAVANLGGTGLMTVQNGLTAGSVAILGTANQIGVANGNGVGSPTVSLVSNPVIPGTGAVTVPSGSNAQQPVGAGGQFRYNSDSQLFEGYAGGSWGQFSLTGGVSTFSGGTTGLTPAVPTNGVVTLGGTLNVANGGTGAATLTGYVKGAGVAVMTASSTIPTTDLSGTVTNVQIANPQVTFNGITVALGASGTITAATPNALTFGTGFTAGSFTGAVVATIDLANTAVAAGSYTLASITVDGQGRLTAASSGSDLGGDVVGPASSVNDRVVFFNGTTGKLIKDSGLLLSGSNTGDQTITLTDGVTGSGTGTFAATVITNANLTGDVTSSGNATTLVNIPTATPAAGSIIQDNIVAPASPAAGKVSIFADSTDLRFHDKNAAGVIGTTVVADAGASNNFLTAISIAGAISKAQPAFTNLSGSVADAQMPALTGDVTMTAGQTITVFAAGSAGNLNSGTLPDARMPDLTGDVTTVEGAVATTLATVNANTGAWGSATASAQITLNGKGLATAAANVTITPAVGSITGLGANVATALGVAIGSTGAPVLFNGAGGTPSSFTLTNATGQIVAGISGGVF